MKYYFAAAGALLLGTSALAWAPGSDGIDPAWKEAGVSASQQLKSAVNDVLAETKAEPAAWADSAFKAEPAAWTGGEPVLQPAAAAWMDEEAVKPADDESVAKVDKLVDDKWALKDEPAPVAEGVGGPLDEQVGPAPRAQAASGGRGDLLMVEATALDSAPRPAAHNYPPCDPGPGDDNCIQLYEPGVRTALASWNAPTGGLAGDNQVAMGGPYEPVEAAAVDTRETAEAAKLEEDPTSAGIGGPVAESGYPPCSGSPSDDRCIQLYERGVTGEGN